MLVAQKPLSGLTGKSVKESYRPLNVAAPQQIKVTPCLNTDEMKGGTGFKAHSVETAQFGLVLMEKVLMFKTRGL